MKKKRSAAVLVTSAIGILAIGYAGYRHFKQPAEPLVYQGTGKDYALSFYNHKGQKLSELDGALKLLTDPFTIFANYPHQRSASFSIDGNGFREGYVNSSAEKLAIVVGGSAAFGQGLPDNHDTFASLISRSNGKYNVMNAATAGYLSGQELSQMVHSLDRFSPSLYIVFDGWNDIFDPYTYSLGRSWPITGGPIGFNNAFLAMEDRLEAANRLLNPDKKETPTGLANANQTYQNEREYLEAIIATYVSNIGKMHDFANARKADLLIVFQPELCGKKALSPHEQAVLKKWNRQYKYHDRGIPDNYRRLISRAKIFCREQGIAYIDINEEAQFSENTDTLFLDVVHPNREGHRIIAEIVNTMLAKRY